MTDELRELDRQSAELLYPGKVEDYNGSEGWFIRTATNRILDGDAFQPTSDPAAAHLLIEDLRKKGVETLSVMSSRFSVGPTTGWANSNGVSELELIRIGDTWMEAVARFYVAVKGGSE